MKSFKQLSMKQAFNKKQQSVSIELSKIREKVMNIYSSNATQLLPPDIKTDILKIITQIDKTTKKISKFK